MNGENNIKEILNKESSSREEELYFNGYLIPGNLFSLNDAKGNLDQASKFMIELKPVNSVPVNEELYNQISSKIIDYTQKNKVAGMSGCIYVIEDEFKQFADWLKQKYQGFVVSVTFEQLKSQYIQKQEIKVEEPVGPVVTQNEPAIPQAVVNNVEPQVSVQPNEPVVSQPVVDNEVSQVNTQATNVVTPVNEAPNSNLGEVSTNNVVSVPVPEAVDSPQPVNAQVAPQVETPVNNVTVQEPTVGVEETVSQGPVVNVSGNAPTGVSDTPANSNFEFNGTPIDRSQENNVSVEQGHTRTLGKVASVAGRAGFVKFPVFLLTIMAIGAFGIFIGKMFYAYLSQQ